MYYSKIIFFDTGNARGISTVLFVSGCEHYCPGCFNPETWDFKAGHEFTAQEEQQILDSFNSPYIKNFVISGGDPLHPRNREDVFRLCRRVKESYPNINIIVYTGYSIEEIDNLSKDIDIVIDGEYKQDFPSPILDYRGSMNQQAWSHGENISSTYFRVYEQKK